jgi:hypothetical protein
MPLPLLVLDLAAEAATELEAGSPRCRREAEVEVAVSFASKEMRRAPRRHTGEEQEEAPNLLPTEGKLEVAAGSAPGGGRGPGGVTERSGMLQLPVLGATPR